MPRFYITGVIPLVRGWTRGETWNGYIAKACIESCRVASQWAQAKARRIRETLKHAAERDAARDAQKGTRHA